MDTDAHLEEGCEWETVFVSGGVKQFKKRRLTQSINMSEIVRAISKTIWPPNVLSFSCSGTRLFQHWEPQEAEHAPLWPVTSGDPSHLSAHFMLYAQNYSLDPNIKELYRPEEIGPKLKVLSLSHLCPFSLQKVQICDSHINFNWNRKHFAGS